MNTILGYGAISVFTVLGAAFAFRGRTVRDWLIRAYNNPAITRHFSMPGFLLGMRAVGLGWLVLGLVAIVAAVRAQISK
ncbi:MAG: hypothetical protein ACREEW_08250 [Caulobacteraceae bacterium]